MYFAFYFTTFIYYFWNLCLTTLVNFEVFMFSMSSLACFDLVTSVMDFFCVLTLVNVLRKFKLSRLSSLVYELLYHIRRTH